MVVICDLHLAIFLEICGAVAFLHSLLMSAIVVSDKFADAILVFVCVAIRCVFFLRAYCLGNPSRRISKAVSSEVIDSC